MTILFALWEKSGIFTKLVILWACGPAFLVWLALGLVKDFRSEIMADTRVQWEQMAAPHIIRRDDQFHLLNGKLTEQGRDIREIRNYLLKGK